MATPDEKRKVATEYGRIYRSGGLKRTQLTPEQMEQRREKRKQYLRDRYKAHSNTPEDKAINAAAAALWRENNREHNRTFMKIYMRWYRKKMAIVKQMKPLEKVMPPQDYQKELDRRLEEIQTLKPTENNKCEGEI